MKKLILLATVVMFLSIPLASFGAMGQMGLKSQDVDIQFSGSLKCYPTFMDAVGFNEDVNSFILDENGFMADHSIRNELRLRWSGTGENWNFFVTLEADFNLNKANGDRGLDNTSPTDSGMSGEDFGVEQMHFAYDFGLFGIETGWAPKFLDVQTGGLVYGDDHPYIGITGKLCPSFSWEALYLIIQDDIDKNGVAGSPWDADSLDWRAYTLKGIYKMPCGFVISPFYAFSDNDENNSQSASVHYFGAEAYGKLGLLTPRFEIAFATGDTNKNALGQDYDIGAWAAYGSVDINISTAFTPYLGFTYMTGDDDDTDDDIEAWNGITDISRYTPTFGIENALIYRMVPSLGSALYSHTFDGLAGGGATPGYGGVGNSCQGSSPGLIEYGLGVKGRIADFGYKVQAMCFFFDEEGALEQIYGTDIDDEAGIEFDLRLTYKFSNHFTLGNTLSIFSPGDAIEDIYGDDYDDTAILNTVELMWKW